MLYVAKKSILSVNHGFMKAAFCNVLLHLHLEKLCFVFHFVCFYLYVFKSIMFLVLYSMGICMYVYRI